MDFDEIKNTWKNSLRDDQHLNKDEIVNKIKIKSESNTALNKVKRSYKIELITGGTIAIFFMIWMYINLVKEYRYIFLSFSFIFFGILLLFTWRNYRKVSKTVISSDQLKPALMKTIQDIEKYVDFNMSNFAKYLLLPFAICFGMMVGLFISAGNQPLLEIFTLREIIKLVVTLVVLSALFIPLSQFMTRRMYKQHLDELKQCLKEFDEITY